MVFGGGTYPAPTIGKFIMGAGGGGGAVVVGFGGGTYPIPASGGTYPIPAGGIGFFVVVVVVVVLVVVVVVGLAVVVVVVEGGQVVEVVLVAIMAHNWHGLFVVDDLLSGFFVVEPEVELERPEREPIFSNGSSSGGNSAAGLSIAAMPDLEPPVVSAHFAGLCVVLW